jgi:hypothetical protein
MAKPKKSEDVPKTMEAKFNSIVELTDGFARQHLNQEYAQLIRQATAALCRKRPSPLEKGQEKTWACGISHAIGMVNFLFDPTQDPHISASELYQWFGVAASTGQQKSKLVRDTLKMYQDDFGGAPAGDVTKTLIGSLDLAVEEPFGYWFDFGDDWWHQIDVQAITEPQPQVKYPRITNRIGASPPQYADL